jgi:hypothetical protein
MSDNPDDKPIDNQINTQSENLSPEIIPVKDVETTNPNHENENMEVHHHPHAHGKKGWKDYFWEFLMLFLAVFCGFLAEYQREHLMERQRGREYIFSFYEDLKNDTATYGFAIRFEGKRLEGLKNIFSCYDTLLKDWKSTNCLVSLARNSSFNRIVTTSDGTIQQLKNAGGFRLLHKEDRDSIVTYDYAVRFYRVFEEGGFQQSQENVRNTFSMLQDFRASRFLSSRDTVLTEVPILFSNNKELLNKYFNDLFRYQIMLTQRIQRLKSLDTTAIHQVAYFKNKYSLE